MKRVLGLIVIFAVASIGASSALAQSRRVRRAEPPKDERVEKSDEQGEAKDESKDKPQDKANEDQPLTGKEVTVRAVIKTRPNPGYPPEARPHGVQGQVKLRIILGSDGRIGKEIKVLEGLPYGVTEEAIKAARRIEFEPARRKDGRPVSQYVTVIYNFNLH